MDDLETWLDNTQRGRFDFFVQNLFWYVLITLAMLLQNRPLQTFRSSWFYSL